jgi:hypothetical protein
LERHTKFHPLIVAVLAFFVLLFYITFKVIANHLWEPSAGLEVLFEMVFVFISTFLLFIFFLIMTKYHKIKKSSILTAFTLSIISPFLFYAVALMFHYINFSQYLTNYCFTDKNKNYYIMLDSKDSSSSIYEIIRPGVSTGYFNGKFSFKNDTIYIVGKKVITYNTLEDKTYLIVNNRIIGFSDNSTEIIIKKCSKPDDSDYQ